MEYPRSLIVRSFNPPSRFTYLTLPLLVTAPWRGDGADAVVARHRTLSQVGKFAQLLQSIGRQRMSEVEQQGRRAVLVYY